MFILQRVKIMNRMILIYIKDIFVLKNRLLFKKSSTFALVVQL